MRTPVPPADRAALTVAMAVVPGLYARNRLFSLFGDPEVRRAKARASMLRGVVRQLTGAFGEVEALTVQRHDDGALVRYRIPRVHLERRVELTALEAACLVYLAARAGVRGVHPSPEDRAQIDAALRQLTGDLRLEAVEGTPRDG